MQWPALHQNVPYRNLADESAWLSYDPGWDLSLNSACTLLKLRPDITVAQQPRCPSMAFFGLVMAMRFIVAVCVMALTFGRAFAGPLPEEIVARQIHCDRTF